MDKICIRRLEVYAYHGVYEEEKRLGQKFYITVEMELDTRAAGISDDLQASVNYGEVCLGIVEWTKSHRRKLIEAAAEDIAHYLLVQYPMVRKVTVELEASVNYGEVCQRMAEWTKKNRRKLIEAAAEDLARYLLLQYPMVRKVTLELEKPGAPVPYAFDTVLVHIARSRHRALLGIGSNLGDRQMNLAAAIQLLDTVPDVKVLKRSPFYETAPYGYTDQPAFINGCLEIETLYTPEELLVLLHDWGPRTVDLDILFYDDLILDTPDLQIPHIDLANREFVLKPLSDIAGTFRHPLLNQTVNELLAVLKKKNK